MMAPASNVTADTDVHYPNTVRACQLVEQSWRNTATLYGYEEYDIDTESKLQNRRRYDIVAGAFSVSAYPSAAYLLRYEHAGCESPRADVEAIAIAKRGLDAMGIKRSAYNLRINDSEMLDLLLSEYLDLDAVQTSLMARLLAQKRTLAPDKFRDRAIDIVGLSHSSEVLQKLSKLLTARSAEDLPEVIRHSECYVNLVALYERLERLGIDNVILDITLAHPEYTGGIIFDFTEADATHSALLYKGGRYVNNDLQSSVGGQSDMSNIIELLTRHTGMRHLESATQAYIVTVGNVLDDAERIAEKLRSERVSVEVDYTGRPIDRQIKEAIKKRVRYVMTVDEQSVAKGLYNLQNIRENSEQQVSFERVVTAVSDRRHHQQYDEDDDVFDLSDIL
jgi:histidyl-tRNA synthetase